MKELKNRLNKIKKLVTQVDRVMLFAKDPGFFYFTNSRANGIFLYDFCRPKLFVSSMEEISSRKSWIKDVVVIKRLRDVFQEAKGRIGVDKNQISASLSSKIKNKVDVSKELENARAIKTDYEIRCIKKACQTNKDVLLSIKEKMSGTEQQLRAEIDYEILRRGSEPAFNTIVASGTNTRIPHHIPEKKKLSRPVLVDFGACCNGYKTDITRTIGHPMQEKIEKIIKELELMIKPGVSAKKLDDAARKMLGSDAKYFNHSLGHGIGIAFEKPHFYSRSKDVLRKNMVFALEIGVYKRTGIRIENNYLVTDKGAFNLTRF